jgi:hypothetical protein
MSRKVTWVSVDDWNAIYVDGKLVEEQNHSISPWTFMEVFRLLGAEVEDLRYSDVAEELAEKLGRFPDTWPPETD